MEFDRCAEVAVHFTLATLPADYVMMTLFVPDDISLQKVNRKELPSDWMAFPHPVSTQAIGDAFVAENRHCVLQIPSAVTFADHNFLPNPAHTEFKKIRIV